MTGIDREPRVLVVEDDEDIAQVSSARCASRATTCAWPPTARPRSTRPPPACPTWWCSISGCRARRHGGRAPLRDDDDVPILMLTARDAVDARVEGLDSGADDYLVKPFERQELLARLRALLRRRPPRGAAALASATCRSTRTRTRCAAASATIELTQREFELLEYLMRNERIVVPRQRLLEEVWGYDPFAKTNTIEVFVSNLRRKLEAGGEPRLLHTIRGAGYVLRA